MLTLNISFSSVSFQIMPRCSEGATACSVARFCSSHQLQSIWYFSTSAILPLNVHRVIFSVPSPCAATAIQLFSQLLPVTLCVVASFEIEDTLACSVLRDRSSNRASRRIDKMEGLMKYMKELSGVMQPLSRPGIPRSCLDSGSLLVRSFGCTIEVRP